LKTDYSAIFAIPVYHRAIRFSEREQEKIVKSMKKDLDRRTLDEAPDSELLLLAKGGKSVAIEVLFHRYKDKLYSIAYGIVGNTSDANDVVQDAFFKSIRKINKLSKEANIAGYLYRTTSTTAIDVIRHKTASKSISFEDLSAHENEIADTQLKPDTLLENSERAGVLYEAIAKLPIDQRVVVVLHHIEDLTVDVIAQRLNIPVGTVKSRLARGRETLRRKLLGKLR
jgi:RNA polymerase sigma-70 factor (ECF subfamily)